MRRRGLFKLLRAREHAAVLACTRFETAGGQTFFDVGCGGGFFSRAAKECGLRVSVIDIAPGMVQAIASQVDDAQVGDVEALDALRTYDIVLCAGVLDFVLDPSIAFSNLARAVARGGRLVVSAPRAGPLGWIYRLEKGAVRIHVNLFSLRSFAEQAASAGLVLRDVKLPLPWNRVLLFDRPINDDKRERFTAGDQSIVNSP